MSQSAIITESLPRNERVQVFGEAESSEIRKFSCIRSLAGLKAIRSDWLKLTNHKPALFQSYSWNRAWYETYANHFDEIQLFVLKRGDVIIALLPCYRKGSRMRLAGDTLCDFQDIISSQNSDAKELLLKLFDYARSHSLHFHFPQLAESGKLYQLIDQHSEAYGFGRYEKIRGPSPWFRLAPDSETFLTGAKAKLRKRIRRALRRLEDLAPEHEFRLLDHSTITESTIADIAELHQKNQYRKDGESIFTDASYRNFLFKAAREPDTGMQIVTVRTKDGELIAFDLGFQSGKRFYAYLGAFDSPFSGGSPGVCLLNWQMDILPGLGINEYDFLCGNEGYKFDYATDSYNIMTVQLYSCTCFNQVRLLCLRTARRLKLMIKPLIMRVGLI